VAAGDRRLKVIEHVGVETEALARFEPVCPDAHAICLGQKFVANRPSVASTANPSWSSGARVAAALGQFSMR
jgi:hypothetical protein